MSASASFRPDDDFVFDAEVVESQRVSNGSARNSDNFRYESGLIGAWRPYLPGQIIAGTYSAAPSVISIPAYTAAPTFNSIPTFNSVPAVNSIPFFGRSQAPLSSYSPPLHSSGSTGKSLGFAAVVALGSAALTGLALEAVDPFEVRDNFNPVAPVVVQAPGPARSGLTALADPAVSPAPAPVHWTALAAPARTASRSALGAAAVPRDPKPAPQPAAPRAAADVSDPFGTF